MSSTSEIDLDHFSAVVKAKRGGKGLRLTADEIGGISAPTLSRIEQGNMPDLDTFVRICRWLDKSPNSFVLNDAGQSESIIGAQGSASDPPQKIEAYLRAEKTLPPETIQALSSMVKLAYRAAAEGKLQSE